MLRLFMVRPYEHAKVSMEWEGKMFHAQSQDDGFFRFEIIAGVSSKPGWHNVVVRLGEPKYQAQKICGEGEVYIPFDSKYVFVSDIDDTFLISYSSRLRKRLYVLLTKNARSRKPFQGVVKHYYLLSSQGQHGADTNPFFYVSSSEWNLFYFIKEFINKNNLPKGVYLLNVLKRFSEVLRTGQGKHATKFFRIVRLIEAYPKRQFVLFGDDSQEDPNIYAALVEHFPGRIYAIYIRRVRKKNYTPVKEVIDKIITSGTHCCYFIHSEEAITHSVSIGLINQNKIDIQQPL